MNKIILAAATILALGTGISFAQGLPPGTTPPQYGSQAFTGQAHQNKTFLSEFFGRSKNSQADQEHKATQAKGG